MSSAKGRYANKTKVSSDTSVAEIQKTVRRYGGSSFFFGWDDDEAQVAFMIDGRKVLIKLTLPSREECQETDTGRRRRSGRSIDKAHEQACRQRYRALALVIKAKLEYCDSGQSSIEHEFLADLCLPNGQPVGESIAANLRKWLEDGRKTPLLEAPKKCQT